MSMKVLIFEPVHTGHRCEYLARIIPAIHALGSVDVTLVATQAGFDSEEFRIHLSEMSTPFDRHVCENIQRHSLIAKTRVATNELEKAIRQIRPDHVYVPGADGVSQVLGTRQLLGRRSPAADVFTEALHFRGAYGYQLDEFHRRVKIFLDGMLVTRAPWSVYYHLDPWQLEALRRRYPKIRERSDVMPDPVDPAAEIESVAARKELGIPEDGIYLGCAGPISRRKGGDLLALAFAEVATKIPAEARLLLAGKFEPSVRQIVQNQLRELVDAGKIVVIDRLLTTREMSIVIPAMDIVTTPYRDHLGSSGILLRAAAAHKPLLTANRHCMNHLVTKFGLGRTCNVRDHQEFSHSIEQAFQWFANFQQPEAAGRFLKFQSEANFLKAWTACLRKRLDLPPDTDRVTWDWVMDAVNV